ncbi:phage tail protein [Burkholderia alba]|uniref:phage tail protein n=1 Tax=Burkholderia alba TaxID=2683677 RepID=UPI002B05E942|nr:phage tail protein [Burkholderia alba]
MGLSALGIQPTFHILANDADVTATIADRLIGITLTDETGEQSDTLEIELSDQDPQRPITKPRKGAELQVFLGYDGQNTRKGLFVVDEIRMGGPPDRMTIRARAAVYAETPKGKSDFQTQKTRTWKSGTRIGDMVAKMAKEHGMTASVSASLASVQLPHLNQDAESDINLLLRLGKRYDAIAKPVGGKLIFARRGDAKTVGGVQLPTVTLRKSDLTDWTCNEVARESAGTVAAYYHMAHKGKRHEVKVGQGEPVKRIRYWFTNQAEALAAATAELQRRKREVFEFTAECPGHPDLTAEGPLILAEFNSNVPTNWIVKRVVSAMSKRAYTCSIEAELPNDPSVAQYEVDTDG